MPAENYGAVADPAWPNSPRQTKGAALAAPTQSQKLIVQDKNNTAPRIKRVQSLRAVGLLDGAKTPSERPARL